MEVSYVYVVSKDGKPLMPTKRFRKVRLWLKNKQAKIISHEPFTIQLLFDTGSRVQSLTFGMDSGYKHAGISVISETREYFNSEIALRTDVSKLMVERAMYRRGRRQRNTRYRPARFNNRKKLGGRRQVLPPSVEQKVASHQRLITLANKILPISEKVIEGNTFDPHKLKCPEISGVDYQFGEMYGFDDNTRAYILARDKHTCYFDVKCDKKLVVRHIISKLEGGSDAPFNLLTICVKHHEQLNQGKIKLGKVNHQSYKEATMMNIVRSQLFSRETDATETFGYITKAKRQALSLDKSHSNDAFVIAGGDNQERCQMLKMAFKRKNNRCLQLNRKGFKPSIRKQRYYIQPKDLVKWHGRVYRAKGMQNKGTFVLLDDGVSKRNPKPIRDVKVVFHAKTLYVCD